MLLVVKVLKNFFLFVEDRRMTVFVLLLVCIEVVQKVLELVAFLLLLWVFFFLGGFFFGI